jgi:hypothetical protein
MKVSIHQPAFNGWLGYYDKIIWSDIFVFLDTVQFEKNSFTNRNKLKLVNGETTWLMIPLKMKGHLGSSMKDLEIDNSQKWRKKHLSTLQMNYSKAPYFKEVYLLIKDLYDQGHDNFSDFSFEFLKITLDYLEVNTKVLRSSELEIDGLKSDLVLNICKSLKASEYLSGINGKDYLDEKSFEDNNIKLHYQSYNHPEYKQFSGNFISHLGIIDFMMNEGRNIYSKKKNS